MATTRPKKNVPLEIGPDTYLDVNQVADLIGLAPGTIWNWRLVGKLPPAAKLGKVVRWRRGDILSWLAERTWADARRRAEGQGVAHE
ncbi:MAG: helix-turn-helix domain-containing protein [Singulisphaera sp.]|nr:helix-turn-helix domain-containing protein [Singulisphaera sp.]